MYSTQAIIQKLTFRMLGLVRCDFFHQKHKCIRLYGMHRNRPSHGSLVLTVGMYLFLGQI